MGRLMGSHMDLPVFVDLSWGKGRCTLIADDAVVDHPQVYGFREVHYLLFTFYYHFV